MPAPPTPSPRKVFQKSYQRVGPLDAEAPEHIWAREQERYEILAQQAPPKSGRRQTLRAKAAAYRSLKKSGMPRGLPALAQILTRRFRGCEAAYDFLGSSQSGTISLKGFQGGIKMLGLNVKTLCGMDATEVFQHFRPNDDNKVGLKHFLQALGAKAEDELDAGGERPVLLAVFENATGSVWRADFLGGKRLADVAACWAEAHAPGVPLPEGLRMTASKGGSDLPLSATLQALRPRLPITEGRYGITVHWPEDAPVVADQGFDSAWRLPKGPSAVIQGERIRWPDGSHTEFQRLSSRSFSMEYGGATRTATLYQNGERLEWSNGQVWRRDHGAGLRRHSSSKEGAGWSSGLGRSRAQVAAICYRLAASHRQPSRPRSRSRGLNVN